MQDIVERHSQSASSSGEDWSASRIYNILLVVLLMVLILVSIIGNCLVCVAIFTERRLRKLGNAFIVSLAIADLFVSCLVMTFALCNELLEYWIFGDWFCDVWISFDIMCCTASILNLCAISLDRFILIKDCLLYNKWMTRRVALSSLILIWFISALVSFVPINLGWHKPDRFTQFRDRRSLTPPVVLGTLELLMTTDQLTSSQSQSSSSPHLFNLLDVQARSGASHKLANIMDGLESDVKIMRQHSRVDRTAQLAPAVERREPNSNYSSDDLRAWRRKRKRRRTHEIRERVEIHGQHATIFKPLEARNSGQHLSPPLKTTTNSMMQLGTKSSSGSHWNSNVEAKMMRGNLKQVEQTRGWQVDCSPCKGANDIDSFGQRQTLESTYSVVKIIPRSSMSEHDNISDKKSHNDKKKRAQRFRWVRQTSDAKNDTNSSIQQDLLNTSQLPQCMLNLTPTYAIVSSTISFYIPCIIMIGLYTKLYVCAMKHVKSIQSINKVSAPLTTSVTPTTAADQQQLQPQLQQKNKHKLKQTRQQHLPERSLATKFTSKWMRDNSVDDDDNNLSSNGRQIEAKQHKAGESSKLFSCSKLNLNKLNLVNSRRRRRTSKLSKDVERSGTRENNDESQNDDKTEGAKGNDNQSSLLAGDRTLLGQCVGPSDCSESCKTSKGAKILEKTDRDREEGGEQRPLLMVSSEPKSELTTHNDDERPSTTATLQAKDSSKVMVAPHGSPTSVNGNDNQTGIHLVSEESRFHNRDEDEQKHQQQQQLIRIQQQQQIQFQLQQQQQHPSGHLATHKAAITLGIIMGTFLFCWVPFFCLNIIKAFCGECVPSSIFRAFTWLGYANSALNPIIYGIHNSEFRHAFNRIFFKHLRFRNNLNRYDGRRYSFEARNGSGTRGQQQQKLRQKCDNLLSGGRDPTDSFP